MLNINKILSKKIKFPLSLRGAKRRSNLSGFSLIELMVAVVILALAIFGIFQAYSTGFMGIADARDRTVATNYLQQTIEDFKNMNFNQVQNEPITPIPGTKFSRGTYVLYLEEIDDVVTLKKVISQVRWIDRKGNIKTEKASTIIYNKPATSEVGDEAVELFLYAQSYYTIMPTNEVNLIAEIKDENGNIYDWNGTIYFSVITDPANTPPVGSLNSSSVQAVSGIANCIFTAISEEELAALGGDVEGTERIQATATVDVEELTDTVNIRVTTGPIGIVIEPVSEEDDRVLAAGAGVESNLKLYVVKADYETHVEYDSPITLSADGPGTLSETTITSVPTDGASFMLASDGTPGMVEITASAPDLDIGYIEITFTGEPASIIITPGKKSIYPGEDINTIVTIVDENNVSIDFDGIIDLSVVPPEYGIFSPNSLDFGLTSLLELESTFTAYTSAPPGETITLQANSGSLSGSIEITILSLLTPKYLKLFAYPTSFDLIEGETYPTITATVYDDSGTEIVTTYNTPITFYAKIGEDNFGSFSDNNVIPIDGEVEVELSSTIAGTTIVTASSDDLILRPEEGWEVVFYQAATHIVLSADPYEIEAVGHETSIITATVCDAGGNEVVNYNDNPTYPKSITFTSTLGKFHILGEDPAETDISTIIEDVFDGGVVIVEFYSDVSSETPAEISAVSSDSFSDNGHIYITLSGDIPSELTLGDISNLDDYEIHFGIAVTGSPIHLKEIQVEWDNNQAFLDKIEIFSPFVDENPLSIITTGSESPCFANDFAKTLVVNPLSDICLNFSNAKMKDNNITVTFTDEADVFYVVSFQVPK